jgi:predicted Rossmann-fold nucleotide-binding protein
VLCVVRTLEVSCQITAPKSVRAATCWLSTTLFGRKFWNKALDFDALVDFGVVAAADWALLDIVDDADEAWAALVRRGLKAQTPADITL